ncbi:hypothetical protein RRR51_002901 [Citrobacter freundii]|uniref:Uncharacterized protein n=1 Tax=Citrobacter portucalensis TaxID=1639133 RepID=A0A9X4GKN3_9ENTR|nr:hypothetical protein [Citrobacter portucalensis]ELI7003092.1 hypothetical protein [Citrobacter freundii]MDE9621042.1 hypothetical protein [Citrobacter portucalensis]
MMNIRFSPEVYEALREAATIKGVSIPALVNSIVKNHILQQEEPNERKEASSKIR